VVDELARNHIECPSNPSIKIRNFFLLKRLY